MEMLNCVSHALTEYKQHTCRITCPGKVGSYPTLDLRPEKNDALFNTKVALRILILIFWRSGDSRASQNKGVNCDTTEPQRTKGPFDTMGAHGNKFHFDRVGPHGTYGPL